MRASALAVLALAAALPGCRGTVPERDRPPEQGIAAVLIGGRMILPTGETKSGWAALNLEGEGGRRAEIYRLPVGAAETRLYLIEPGTYRLFPTRSIFGFHQKTLKVVLDGRTYKLPFPRDILRLPSYDVKPRKILTLGVLETEVQRALPGQKPTVRVRLDDSIAARRKLVQALIRDMMDPNLPAVTRDAAVAWSRQLQNSLLEILAEEEKRALYKPGP